MWILWKMYCKGAIWKRKWKISIDKLEILQEFIGVHHIYRLYQHRGLQFSFRRYLRYYCSLISLLVVMFGQRHDKIRLLHSDDLFPQLKTKSSILSLPEKETSFTSSGGPEEPAEEPSGIFQSLWPAWFSFYNIKKKCNFEQKPKKQESLGILEKQCSDKRLLKIINKVVIYISTQKLP